MQSLLALLENSLRLETRRRQTRPFAHRARPARTLKQMVTRKPHALHGRQTKLSAIVERRSLQVRGHPHQIPVCRIGMVRRTELITFHPVRAVVVS